MNYYNTSTTLLLLFYNSSTFKNNCYILVRAKDSSAEVPPHDNPEIIFYWQR